MRRPTIFFAGLLALFVDLSWSFDFPEEADRSGWDRGCPDWPVEIPDSSDSLLKRNPQISLEKTGGVLRVFVKMTITADRGETETSLLQTVERSLSDGFTYPKWVLPGINENPQGGSYFVSVDGMTVFERQPGFLYVLTGPYTFRVLWFHRDGVASLLVKHEHISLPACPLFSSYKLPQAQKITYRMTPREDILRLMMAEVWILPVPSSDAGPRQVELRMRLVARPTPLVYALMPEALLRSQIEVRGRRIFENFLDFRKTTRAP